MLMIDNNLKPRKLEVFLAKPNKQIIGKLKHIKNENLKIKNNELNDLSFTLPYQVVMRNKLTKNPHISNIKEKYFIKVKLGEFEEWQVITKLSKISDDSDDLSVQCYSLGYQLKYSKMIDYAATSYNCLQVSTDCLKGTTWKVGYINPEFNLKYRQFDVSSKTKLDFIYEIAETFNAIVKFDTINKTVNFYKEDELSQYKGFNIEFGKYLQSLEDVIDANDIVTRLYIKGANNLGINSVNPTGQSYIDDFSYFMYPFEMDENGKVISHSKFMSDELCVSLIHYNAYVSSRKNDFRNLLNLKKDAQKELTEQNNKLTELKDELRIILDTIAATEKTGKSTSDLVRQRDAKNNEIKKQQNIIGTTEGNIKIIDTNTKQLHEDLKIENHLSQVLLDDLFNYIQVDEWTDENQIDENELYETGLGKLQELSSPPVNMNVEIINFFEMITEKHNWDRLNIGDIVRIRHDILGIHVKTRISEIHFDFEGATINLVISNTKEVESTKNKIKRAFYTIDKVNTDYNSRKINWNVAAQNFNSRNDRISETPTNPTISNSAIEHKENDDGSVNLTLNWEYPDFESTKKNEHNIDGFMIYLHHSMSPETYQFGSKMATETKVDVSYAVRSYTFPSVPANLYYTAGVQAYRRVDEDINREGILLSDVVRFNGTFSPLPGSTAPTPVSSDPYLPKTVVNLTGKLNNSRYTVTGEEPNNPEISDIWVNTTDQHVYIYDGTSWGKNDDLDKAIDFTNKTEEEIRRDVESALKEVDEAMEFVNSEVERIENEVVPRVQAEVDRINNEVVPRINAELDRINDEVIPRINAELDRIENVVVPKVQAEVDRINNEVVPRIDRELDRINNEVVPNIENEMDRIENIVIPTVEQTIRDTYVPKQETPPDPTNGSGLWWDTSQTPPRLKRYNPVTGSWDHVAYTESEVDDLITEARDEITVDYKKYTDDEVTAVRDDLLERLAGTDGRLVDLALVVDETNGLLSTTIETVEQHTNTLSSHKTAIEQNSYDISLRAEETKLIDGRLTKAEAEIKVNADEIDLRVERDGVIASINVTPETIKIDSSKLDIYGVVTFINSDTGTRTLIDGGKIITGSIIAKQLNVNEIFANSAVIDIIQSRSVKTSDLSATNITTGTLDALKVSVQNLSATSITSGVLDALKITVKNFSADNITGGTIDALNVSIKNLSASDIISGTLDALKVTVKDLSASSLTSGTLDAIKVTVKNLSADSIIGGTIDALKVSIKNLSATEIISGELDALKISVKNLSASSIVSGTLDASKVNVENLNAKSIITGELTGIDIRGVNITGSTFLSELNSNNYTKIQGGFLESKGRYTRTWRGETTTNDVRLKLENGYIRARNDTKDGSLYYSDFGISTFVDGSGESAGGRSSGTLEFFSRRFSSAYNGLTLYSSGVLGIDADTFIAESRFTAIIESTDGLIQFRPSSSKRGYDQSFLMSSSNNNGDGYIAYGEKGDASDRVNVGLRFAHSGTPIIDVVDGSYATGGNTGIQAGAGYFNEIKRRDGNSYINIQNSDIMRVGSDSEGSRIEMMAAYNRTYSSAPNMVLTEFGTVGRSTSAKKYKVDIQLANISKAKNILNLQPKSWYDKTEIAENGGSTVGLKRHHGLIAEDVFEQGLEEHVMIFNGVIEGIEYDRMWTKLIPIVKSHDEQLSELSNDIYDLQTDVEFLKLENGYLKQEIKMLKNRLGA